MKYKQSEHFISSFAYQIEQTAMYFKEVGEQFFKKQNIGMTLYEYKILDTVYLNNGICQIDLAKLILKERGFISRIVSQLEEKKYIERRSETKNRRLVKNLYITSKGKEIIEIHTPKLRAIINDIFKDINPDDIAKLQKEIVKLRECVSNSILMKF